MESVTDVWVVLRRATTGSMLAVLHPTPDWMMHSPDARVEYWKAYYRQQMPGWALWGERLDGPNAPDYPE